LLYSTGRGADILPSLEKDPQTIDAALRAATAAATLGSK
jgi:hypothetical protein